MTSNETQTEGRRRRVTLPPSSSDKGAPSQKNSDDPKRISHTEFQKRVTSDRSDEPVLSCEFEVFGIVQGVSFRMYTLRRAQKLGVRGWCKNTNENTVKGEIQAHRHSFESITPAAPPVESTNAFSVRLLNLQNSHSPTSPSWWIRFSL
ncbi:uncharacterized protein LOC120453883 isoform X2 [Drosophila santomea]|uniref:uncharacterized protein LOC120453883 isoform X2 n=1 Tax=Drosophila santomea TaxID=129105 RepID=UPI001952B71B|nr:uncharacterized protein LOC120453883 isoform X2 [Drosophila santomea]